jgi:hypothetical protein
LFFTVSDKSTQPKELSLSSENHQATIAAKLATCNQIGMDVNLLLFRVTQGRASHIWEFIS